MKQMTPLRQVRVASPCKANWDLMKGDDRVRHCGQCDHNVFNLSALSTQEAEALLLEREGRLCVRYFQRSDGTVMTADCPVGRSAVSVRLKSFAMAGVMFLLGGFAWAATIGREKELEEMRGRLLQTEPIKTVVDFVSPPKPIMGKMIVGRIAKKP